MKEMWLARDRDGYLYLYIGKKPTKRYGYGYWVLSGLEIMYKIIPLSTHLFPEVKWSDEEPTKVKLEIEK